MWRAAGGCGTAGATARKEQTRVRGGWVGAGAAGAEEWVGGTQNYTGQDPQPDHQSHKIQNPQNQNPELRTKTRSLMQNRAITEHRPNRSPRSMCQNRTPEPNGTHQEPEAHTAHRTFGYQNTEAPHLLPRTKTQNHASITHRRSGGVTASISSSLASENQNPEPRSQ